MKMGDEETSSAGDSSIAERNNSELHAKENGGICNSLECPVCFERLTVPVTVTCVSGHATCKECFLKVKICPKCQLQLKTSINLLLDEIIEKTTFPCTNADYGCTEEKIYYNIILHEANECNFQIIKCKIFNGKASCDEYINLQQYCDHILEDHADLIVKIQMNELIRRKISFLSADNVFQTSDESLMFIESYIRYNDKSIFGVTCQYVGNIEDASKYISSITLCLPNDQVLKTKFVVKCFSLLKSKCEAVFLLEQGVNDDIQAHYTIKIEKADDYQSRKSKKKS